MAASGPMLDEYEVIARLMEVVDKFPEDQQMVLLRHLVKGDVARFIKRLIIEMAVDERSALLKQLETIRRELRRKSERRPCLIPVDYVSQDKAFKDYIQDVSAAGVFIESKEELEEGQEVILAFSLPNSEDPLKISGRVVRKTDNGYGVKFEQMTPYRESIIEALLEDIDQQEFME